MDDDNRPGVIQDDGFKPAGTGYQPHRKSRRRWMIPLVLITLFVGAPIFAGINFWINIEDYNFEFRDTYTHSAQMSTGDGVLTINIDNVLGDIEIDHNLLDESSLFEISTEVLSNEKGIEYFLDNQWDIKLIGNTYLLSFDVDSSSYDDDIKYNHHIRIHKNITITAINLVTVTGSVDVALDEIKIWESYLESVTGSIKFNLFNSEVNHDITISTTTGSVNILLKNTDLNLSRISIDVVTGDVVLRVEDSDISTDMYINVELVTGSIDLFWKQLILKNSITISLETTSGSIEGEIHLNGTISTSYTYDSVSGKVNLPNNNSGSTGTMTVDASLVTGDIEVLYFQL